MTLGEVVSIYYHNIRGVDIGVFYGDEKTNDQLCEDYLVNALRLIRTATGELCEDERYKRGWFEIPYPGCVATLNDIENLVNGWVLVLNRAADQLLISSGSKEKEPEDYRLVFEAVNALNLFAWKFHCFPNYLPNT